jgi:hypothetical protein
LVFVPTRLREVACEGGSHPLHIRLDRSATWREWSKRLRFYYQEQAMRDAALFIFCATKDL